MFFFALFRIDVSVKEGTVACIGFNFFRINSDFWYKFDGISSSVAVVLNENESSYI